jgi:N-acetylmuramoyl-L-alanine amidase CwlA
MKKGVKLIIKDKTIIPSGLSYINNEGKYVKYDGKYKISGNSYTFTYIDKKQIKLDVKEEVKTKKVNTSLTYFDKDNELRYFNKLETLEFDGNTYTGIVNEIYYINNVVDLIKED